MVKYGSWVVYRYSPSRYPPGIPLPHHPGYTPATTVTAVHGLGMQSREVNMVVGLISVGQLSLADQISDISLMTEVYNLAEIDRINNHFTIPGND